MPHSNWCNRMGWCWRHYGLQRHGGGEECSVSGVVDGMTACYDEAAEDKALCLSQQTKPPIRPPWPNTGGLVWTSRPSTGGLVWAQSNREEHRPEGTNF